MVPGWELMLLLLLLLSLWLDGGAIACKSAGAVVESCWAAEGRYESVMSN